MTDVLPLHGAPSANTPPEWKHVPPAYTELVSLLDTVHDLHAASAVLGWDQMVCLPSGSAETRGRHLATLSRVAHEKFTDDRIGTLLGSLADYETSLPAESVPASLIRVTRQDYQKAIRVPASFMSTLTAHLSTSYQAWTVARPANDFASMVPILERTIDLSREYAGYFPATDHVADLFVDEAEPGLDVAAVRELFSALRTRLVPLVQAIIGQPRPDDAILRRGYPEDAQWRFGEMVATRFGYDFARGRQDRAPHPFTTSFGRDDVRITTRLSYDDLRFGLFATMHEAGHGMYEQGIPAHLDGTLLGSGASSGIHESQSRLWENIVGRSDRFWEWAYPLLQSTFASQLGDVPRETFYRAVNRVEPSLIRVEADEVTYNLHIMMRFDFELALMDGSLRVVDLPEAWRARLLADLGIAPPDDTDGCLQDIHWFASPTAGQFQGYTIGNILASQAYDQAVVDIPTLSDQIATGEFGDLRRWMQTNLHIHGRKFNVAETVRRATGSPLSIEPYMRYLTRKFGALYNVVSGDRD